MDIKYSIAIVNYIITYEKDTADAGNFHLACFTAYSEHPFTIQYQFTSKEIFKFPPRKLLNVI